DEVLKFLTRQQFGLVEVPEARGDVITLQVVKLIRHLVPAHDSQESNRVHTARCRMVSELDTQVPHQRATTVAVKRKNNVKQEGVDPRVRSAVGPIECMKCVLICEHRRHIKTSSLQS